MGDGAGGLFGSDATTLERTFPTPPERWHDAELLASGRDGYELFTCVRGRCAVELHDRVSGTVVPAAPFSTFSDPTALSPGNRYVAHVAQGPDDDDEVPVHEATSGALRRTVAGGGYAKSFTWLSDRWMVATSGLGLVLYDAVDDVLIRPKLPIDGMSQLVWRAS